MRGNTASFVMLSGDIIMGTSVFSLVSVAKQFAQVGLFFLIVVIAVTLAVLARRASVSERARLSNMQIELRVDRPALLVGIPLFVLPALEAWLQR